MTNTTQVSATVDVVTKYTALVTASLNGDSVYIRAKETIKELVSDGTLDGAKQAEIISGIIGGVVSSITSSAMSTALDWAKYETDTALKKLEMDQSLGLIGQEILLKTAQVTQVKDQSRLALVESKRMYGTSTFVGDTLSSLAEDGKVWNDMKLVSQQTLNAGDENYLIKSKLKESKVAIHKVVADTFTNFGAFSFSYDGDEGISTVTRNDVGHLSLSDTQQKIAIEQGKGYTYNAWANALTGSASMLGTSIASGDFSFNPGSNELRLFDAVVSCAESLKAASSISDDATPSQ